MACCARGKKKKRQKFLFLYTRQYVVIRSLRKRSSEKYLNTVYNTRYILFFFCNDIFWAIFTLVVHKVFYSVTTEHQYIVNNTQFWLHVSVSSKHPRASIYYMKVHSMCAYIMGSLIVYTNKS
jgi:hypothetical protein